MTDTNYYLSVLALTIKKKKDKMTAINPQKSGVILRENGKHWKENSLKFRHVVPKT